MFQAVHRSLNAAVFMGVLALSAFSNTGHAQTGAPAPQRLPETVVTASRLGAGIPGASTTIITEEEIARSPATTLPEMLAQEAGIQIQSLYGASAAGARTSVDLRGFGAAASANTLVLVNGRRLNDVDLAGIDFITIPRDSIERIEITRGNSGAVLYGDGATGGVINIITKTGQTKPYYKVGGGLGSYARREGSASAAQVFGPVSTAISTNIISADGYRINNKLRQRNLVGDLRSTLDSGTAYLNFAYDHQYLGFPGVRQITQTSNAFETNPRGATTERDFGTREGFSGTLGVTRELADNVEMIFDLGARSKEQHTETFSSSGAAFDAALDTTLLTFSATPRLNIGHDLFGVPSKTVTGLDLYRSMYESDRRVHANDAPNHHYDVDQLSVGSYLQETVAVRRDTDVSLGARFQLIEVAVRDRLNTSAPGGSTLLQGRPLDHTEGHYAAHAGIDHRLTEEFAVFGRFGRSLRVPTVDERVGQSPFGTTPVFDLRSQTSHDMEAGFRVNYGPAEFQSSAYVMKLKNELHFEPVTFTVVNLDPTKRQGVENSARLRVSDTLRLKGGITYTEAEFRSGQFAGKEVPLVSPWTKTAGLSWDIVPDYAVFDFNLRHTSQRRFDNDQRNFQPKIPSQTTADVRLAGAIETWMNWSLGVQNIGDSHYFDYGVASASTFGTRNVYPLPGRTYLATLGLTF
jgi:iron complex outermembrane recepter protein